MALTTTSRFVEGLLQSQVLDSKQGEEILQLQEKYPEPRHLAQELLRRDWLTAFQINQIFQGKGAGLHVGPYILMDRLGEGGMGQVFKARQKSLNRIVALKIIRKDCLDNPKTVLRFQREIRAASQLSHPNIVRAFDADEVRGTYYFAMEFVKGIDLARMVQEEGPMRLDQALDYIRQAALGLQHAAERGLVHRDIKPANLLVTHVSSQSRPDLSETRWGTLKILDMGLARCSDPITGQSATHLTQIGSVMGTPDYIAPEQARDSHSTDVRADLYSLGCTLYFLLTGQPPFPQGSITEKLLLHQFDEPAPLNQVRMERLQDWCVTHGLLDAGERMLHVPKQVVRLVERLMAKNPADRYQTPLELANELDWILKQLDAGLLVTEVADTRIDGEMGVTPVASRATETVFEPIIRLPQHLAQMRWEWLALGGVIFTGLASLFLATVITAMAFFSRGRPAGPVVQQPPVNNIAKKLDRPVNVRP